MISKVRDIIGSKHRIIMVMRTGWQDYILHVQAQTVVVVTDDTGYNASTNGIEIGRGLGTPKCVRGIGLALSVKVKGCW